MANDLLYLPLRLIPSARDQKDEAKPGALRFRERSQRAAAMRLYEVASLASERGLRLGRGRGRASPFRAKSVLSAYFETGLGVAYAVSDIPMPPVFHAITSCQRSVHLTDEVPRRLDPKGRATWNYKSHTKGSNDASEMGTVSSRPHPKGQQQSRSRRSPGCANNPARLERQNLNVSDGSSEFMDLVSAAAQATKWSGRTSSCQPASMLRNKPQQLRGIRPTVRQC
jgi:hypothetical protein